MNKSENSIRQPYEVIETLEETITRYFNPNSKDATFCTTEHFSVNLNNLKRFGRLTYSWTYFYSKKIINMNILNEIDVNKMIPIQKLYYEIVSFRLVEFILYFYKKK